MTDPLLVDELRRRVAAARKAYLAARAEVGEGDGGDCQLGAALSMLAEALGADDLVVAAVAERLVSVEYDYDLLADVIAEACPGLMTDEATWRIAQRALAALARIDGVTVVRGPDGKPWQPEPEIDPELIRGIEERPGEARGR